MIHKAFIDVHEEGTEAAAATAVIAAPPSAPPQHPKAAFHVDRPFVLLIRENQTGSILFMGRITNPVADKE
ncbi:Serpin (serine protease inhibitor) [compost metagenome]